MLYYITIIKNQPNETLNCFCDPKIIMKKKKCNLLTADLRDFAVKWRSITDLVTQQNPENESMLEVKILIRKLWNYPENLTNAYGEEHREELAVKSDIFSACGWCLSVN